MATNANALPIAPAEATALLQRLLSSSAARASHGTAAPLRRALASRLNTTDGEQAREYARVYLAALSESLLLFLHLSKSGGTGLCELAKLNGCSRAAPGQRREDLSAKPATDHPVPAPPPKLIEA